MKLSVVVVHYGRAGLLDACLASVARSLDRWAGASEVLVADNGSPDGSGERVCREHPGTRRLDLPANPGFGAAVNAGVAASDGEWVLVLNNDLVLDDPAVERLVDVASTAAGDVGALAAQMRFADGSERVNSAGIEIDSLGVAHDRRLGLAPDHGDPVEVFGASAGAALYRRTMLEQLGGFHEPFFLYLEDADLAWRARAEGWRTLYVPDAVVHHVHSAASGHNSPLKHHHVGRNRVRLLARNADARMLRRRGWAIVAYDAAYVAYALAADRTLAPLTGRLGGVRRWRSWRRGRTPRPVELGPVQGLRGALTRRRAWGAKGPPGG